jgi:hypothetical protein
MMGTQPLEWERCFPGPTIRRGLDAEKKKNFMNAVDGMGNRREKRMFLIRMNTDR